MIFIRPWNALLLSMLYLKFVKTFENSLQPVKDVPYDTHSSKRASAFMRIGKQMLDGENKRYSSFVRIGKNIPGDDDVPEKRYSNFVRIGKSSQEYDTPEKKFSHFVRIGKNNPDEDKTDDKRLSSFVRIGKNTETADTEKRMRGFMRIGKGMNSDENFGKNAKRLSSFVRIGKNHIAESETSGKSNDDLDEQMPSKRGVSSFVRIGKGLRHSAFMRIGRDPKESDSNKNGGSNGENEVKNRKDDRDRLNQLARIKRAFIRIGKIPSSAFMRIGRRPLFETLMKDRYFRSGRLGHSSFVRIGKRSTNAIKKRTMRSIREKLQ